MREKGTRDDPWEVLSTQDSMDCEETAIALDKSAMQGQTKEEPLDIRSSPLWIKSRSHGMPSLSSFPTRDGKTTTTTTTTALDDKTALKDAPIGYGPKIARATTQPPLESPAQAPQEVPCFACGRPKRDHALHNHRFIPNKRLCPTCNTTIKSIEEQAIRLKDDWKSDTGDTDGNSHIDECLGCGRDDGEDVYLCDKCPRAFCRNCLLNTYGEYSETFRSLDDGEKGWTCHCCEPPLSSDGDPASSSSEDISCPRCFRSPCICASPQHELEEFISSGTNKRRSPDEHHVTKRPLVVDPRSGRETKTSDLDGSSVSELNQIPIPALGNNQDRTSIHNYEREAMTNIPVLTIRPKLRSQSTRSLCPQSLRCHNGCEVFSVNHLYDCNQCEQRYCPICMSDDIQGLCNACSVAAGDSEFTETDLAMEDASDLSCVIENMQDDNASCASCHSDDTWITSLEGNVSKEDRRTSRDPHVGRPETTTDNPQLDNSSATPSLGQNALGGTQLMPDQIAVGIPTVSTYLSNPFQGLVSNDGYSTLTFPGLQLSLLPIDPSNIRTIHVIYSLIHAVLVSRTISSDDALRLDIGCSLGRNLKMTEIRNAQKYVNLDIPSTEPKIHPEHITVLEIQGVSSASITTTASPVDHKMKQDVYSFMNNVQSNGPKMKISIHPKANTPATILTRRISSYGNLFSHQTGRVTLERGEVSDCYVGDIIILQATPKISKNDYAYIVLATSDRPTPTRTTTDLPASLPSEAISDGIQANSTVLVTHDFHFLKNDVGVKGMQASPGYPFFIKLRDAIAGFYKLFQNKYKMSIQELIYDTIIQLDPPGQFYGYQKGREGFILLDEKKLALNWIKRTFRTRKDKRGKDDAIAPNNESQGLEDLFQTCKNALITVCRDNGKNIPNFSRAWLLRETVNAIQISSTLPSKNMIAAHNIFSREIDYVHSYKLSRDEYNSKMDDLGLLYKARCVTTYDEWMKSQKGPNAMKPNEVLLTFHNDDGFQKVAETCRWFHHKVGWVRDATNDSVRDREKESIDHLTEMMEKTGIVIKGDLDWIEGGVADAAYRSADRTDNTCIALQYTSQLCDGPEGRRVIQAEKSKAEIEEMLRRHIVFIDDIFWRNQNDVVYHCGSIFIPPTVESLQYLSQLQDFDRITDDPFKEGRFSVFSHLWFSPRGTTIADPANHLPTLAKKAKIMSCMRTAIQELEAIDQLRHSPDYFIAFSPKEKRAEKCYLDLFAKKLKPLVHEVKRTVYESGDMVLVQRKVVGGDIVEKEYKVEFKGRKSTKAKDKFEIRKADGDDSRIHYDPNEMTAYVLVVYDSETLLPLSATVHPSRTTCGENNMRDPTCTSLYRSTGFVDSTCVTFDFTKGQLSSDAEMEEWRNLIEKLMEFGDRPKRINEDANHYVSLESTHNDLVGRT